MIWFDNALHEPWKPDTAPEPKLQHGRLRMGRTSSEDRRRPEDQEFVSAGIKPPRMKRGAACQDARRSNKEPGICQSRPQDAIEERCLPGRP